MTGTLFVVPTPVGNLQDMTFRAIEVLSSVSLILAEDTRVSGKLLKHYGIATPMQPFHQNNEHSAVGRFAARLTAGDSLALVTDAGTPGISDPGFLLVREAVRVGAEVITLPGATAFVPALVSSGLPCDKFYFEGFLPHKKGRATRIAHLAGLPCTVVLYESPHRLLKTLSQLKEACGGSRPVSASREISKLHEETVRGSLDEALAHFAQHSPRGEFVLVLGAAGGNAAHGENQDED